MRKFDREKFPKCRWEGDFNPPKNKPLIIEIGCGVGLHPIQYAEAHKDKFLVAIEHTQEKFDKFRRRFINHGQPNNLFPVHANALSWINDFVQNDSVDQYIILYPNPYPKSSHENKRFYAMPFFERLLETLKVNGTILMATNELFYYEGHKKNLKDIWNLNLVSDEKFNLGDIIPRTHFEKKYLERGESVHQLVFKKEPHQ